MIEHLVCVLATDSRAVPARVCGLLAQRNIPVSSIQMSMPMGSQNWWLQLVVVVDEPEEVELVVKRLNRLVDVIKVIDLGSQPNHQRRPVFVKLHPVASDLVHVGEIARLFAAEVVEAAPGLMSLYLAADPERCDQFVAMLAPYGVVETALGAVCGIRGGRASANTRTARSAKPALSDGYASIRLNA